MRIAFSIDIHSALDVITNSSSELFVISNETTVEAVTEMLQFMVDQWNLMAVKGVFGEYHMRNRRASLSGEEQIQGPVKTFDEMFGRIMLYEEDDQKEEAERIRDQNERLNERYPNRTWNAGWGYEVPENVGKIIVQSRSDNSIPHEIMEWIDSAFSAKRWHLG